ncbi:MAG: TetR family transcriptional regulator [Rhodospirillales bacterium]|nr:TetR family transcriptional regulator [Rhodospirillales bacterium]
MAQPVRHPPEEPRTSSRRKTRAEKSEKTRRAIVEAAARIIGRYGYENASIARIAARARIAHGTFYKHFGSRQDLFDRVLPEMGDRLLEFIQANVDRHAAGAHREEQRLRAYIKFLVRNPWFQRLVNDSEVMAPKAHKAYFERLASGYVRGLTRSIARNEIKAFDRTELECVAYILMATRLYLAQRYAYSHGSVSDPPEAVVRTYVKFVQRALFD